MKTAQPYYPTLKTLAKAILCYYVRRLRFALEIYK